MTPAQRTRYFKHFWPAACAANGWSARDDERRKHVTRDCMEAIAGPATDSTSKLGEDEVTALFCYLDHLAAPDDLNKSARWVSCQDDYRTYNRARQADWHERSLYGRGRNKLDKNRFDGETSASGGPLDTLDADEVRKRHLTMASRHQKKLRAGPKTTKHTEPATPEAVVTDEAPVDFDRFKSPDPVYIAPADTENEPF